MKLFLCILFLVCIVWADETLFDAVNLQYPAFDDIFYGNSVMQKTDRDADIPPSGECSTHFQCGFNGFCQYGECKEKLKTGSSCSYSEQCKQDYLAYGHAVICHPINKVCMPFLDHKKGEACSHDVDCEKQFFCVNNKCSQTDTCTQHSDCGTTAFCLKNSCEYNDVCRTDYYDDLVVKSHVFKGKRFLPDQYYSCLTKGKSDRIKSNYYTTYSQSPEPDVVPLFEKRTFRRFLDDNWQWIVGVLSTLVVILAIVLMIVACCIYYQYRGYIYIQKKKETLEIPLIDDQF
mmetsp:Transcript_7438/g.11002  ORF Transcript_7438/g.11002 Transcript_7438/m.11002 type:complete len:289 (+) Transcript_7438:1697-2563(+)